MLKCYRYIVLEVNFTLIFYFPWFILVLSSNFCTFAIHFSDKRQCLAGQGDIPNPKNCSRSLHGKREVSSFKIKKGKCIYNKALPIMAQILAHFLSVFWSFFSLLSSKRGNLFVICPSPPQRSPAY